MEDGTATATVTPAMEEGEEGLAPTSSAQANEVALSAEIVCAYQGLGASKGDLYRAKLN
jgi:hypothetical protein